MEQLYSYALILFISGVGLYAFTKIVVSVIRKRKVKPKSEILDSKPEKDFIPEEKEKTTE